MVTFYSLIKGEGGQEKILSHSRDIEVATGGIYHGGYGCE